MSISTLEAVIDFWFKEISPSSWWKKDPEFDATVRERFLYTYNAATVGELVSWRKSPVGRLAEIIVLDQFSRNMFRDRPEAFRFDSVALVLAQEAVSNGAIEEIADERRSFMIMPFMHSESKFVHEQAVEVFQKYAPGSMKFELKHKKIIDAYGRYPHRNDVLGRESTPEEIKFLKTPGSSF